LTQIAISGSAKATTPFGPLTGRTPVWVSDFGADSILIEFQCGGTPVQLALAGEHLAAFAHAVQAATQPVAVESVA
jgi:hypothetical protein